MKTVNLIIEQFNKPITVNTNKITSYDGSNPVSVRVGDTLLRYEGTIEQFEKQIGVRKWWIK